jgi:hypothetical protein
MVRSAARHPRLGQALGVLEVERQVLHRQIHHMAHIAPEPAHVEGQIQIGGRIYELAGSPKKPMTAIVAARKSRGASRSTLEVGMPASVTM